MWPKCEEKSTRQITKNLSSALVTDSVEWQNLAPIPTLSLKEELTLTPFPLTPLISCPAVNPVPVLRPLRAAMFRTSCKCR